MEGVTYLSYQSNDDAWIEKFDNSVNKKKWCTDWKLEYFSFDHSYFESYNASKDSK